MLLTVIVGYHYWNLAPSAKRRIGGEWPMLAICQCADHGELPQARCDFIRRHY